MDAPANHELLAIPTEELALVSVLAGQGEADKSVAALSIDGHTLGSTPSGECVRIKVDTLDDDALRLRSFLHFLGSLKPLFPGSGHLVAVFEDASKGRVIFLPKPSESNDAKLGIVGGLSHAPDPSSRCVCAKVPEIEVTPEMVSAGVEALSYQLSDDEFAETASLVYRAMEATRLLKRPVHPRDL